MLTDFLSFSDSAKFADVARNIVGGLGYGSSFTFWNSTIFDSLNQSLFSSSGILPVMPFSIAGFFKIFGVNDFAIIATSILYFILTLIFTFLLSKKIFKTNLVGVVSTIAVGFNYDLMHYAISGASESPFIFEIVAASYLASIKRKWAWFVTAFILLLMFFTRTQAFIYILGIILFWLLDNFKIRKAILFFIAIIVSGLLVDRLILLPLVGNLFFYSITNIGIRSSLIQTVSGSASDALRGAIGNVSGGVLQITKNIFYNLYNFFKLLPQIISPYLFALFTIGLFLPLSHKTTESQVKLLSAFKTASVFMIAVTFLVTAASIPFFRYLHPIIPLVYIIAVGTLVEMLDLGFTNYDLRISKRLFLILTSLILILVFGVGQTLGVLLLDSRFERNTHNVGRPPVYVELSKILKENTKSTDVVVTNLDTWGSWYGERKTLWFPVEPKQIVDPSTGKIPFDAIYLTSYLIDDTNYYMGDNWRMIFENPNEISKLTCEGCKEIVKYFTVKGVYKLTSTNNYERQDAKAVLFVKK